MGIGNGRLCIVLRTGRKFETFEQEAGIENIQNYLEELTDFLCELLAGKNYEIISSREKGEKSQIVCIKHRNGLTSNEIAKKLQNENNIVISPRGIVCESRRIFIITVKTSKN